MLQKDFGKYLLVKDNFSIKLIDKEKNVPIRMLRLSDYSADIIIEIVMQWLRDLDIEFDEKELFHGFFFKI
ncbi:MAG: hypothetical protein J7L07_01685 [Candidatus Odinarchaeota archaeon]|nr:hypothetical protein [Candidatus Odinarchaeota archaeon]